MDPYPGNREINGNHNMAAIARGPDTLNDDHLANLHNFGGDVRMQGPSEQFLPPTRLFQPTMRGNDQAAPRSPNTMSFNSGPNQGSNYRQSQFSDGRSPAQDLQSNSRQFFDGPNLDAPGNFMRYTSQDGPGNFAPQRQYPNGPRGHVNGAPHEYGNDHAHLQGVRIQNLGEERAGAISMQHALNEMHLRNQNNEIRELYQHGPDQEYDRNMYSLNSMNADRRLKAAKPRMQANARPNVDVPNQKLDPSSNVLTTVIVQNIPKSYTQPMLLEVWPPDGTYDFLYLPFSFNEKCNFGYAFMNFVTHEDAKCFINAWRNQSLLERDGYGQQIEGLSLSIDFASLQGRDKIIHRLLKSKARRIKNVNYQPVIFNGMQRVDFQKYMSGKGKMKEQPVPSPTMTL
jgi:hypothetical protein